MSKLITPESLVIEKTALELATSFWETGKLQGLNSKYKDASSYARRYVKEFIPLAVSILMDMLAKDNIPIDQKDMIYMAIMERTNDVELSNALPIFNNPLAAGFKPDWKDDRKPLVINSNPLDLMPIGHDGNIEDLPLKRMLENTLIEEKKDKGNG